MVLFFLCRYSPYVYFIDKEAKYLAVITTVNNWQSLIPDNWYYPLFYDRKVLKSHFLASFMSLFKWQPLNKDNPDYSIQNYTSFSEHLCSIALHSTYYHLICYIINLFPFNLLLIQNISYCRDAFFCFVHIYIPDAFQSDWH